MSVDASNVGPGDAPQLDSASLAFDKGGGLIAAIVQHAKTHDVLMLGYMNADALRETLARKRVVFYSRTRERLWEKGETSGHTLDVVAVRADCDRDTLLIQALPRGPVCHTGTATCFGDVAQDAAFLSASAPAAPAQGSASPQGSAPAPGSANASAAHALGFLAHLEAVIAQRATEAAGRSSGDSPSQTRESPSYTARLLKSGTKRVAQKVGEEGVETALAGVAGPDEELAGEAADLIYHLLVLLHVRNMVFQDVLDVLASRAEAGKGPKTRA